MKKIIFILTHIFSVFLIQAQSYEVIDVSIEGEVKELKNINTQGVEFSPVLRNEELIFTSNREFDLVTLGENNWKKAGYLNVYKTDIRKTEISENMEFKNVKLFSYQIKNLNHTGPVCFTSTGDTLFFTQVPQKVKKSKIKEYKPQIYMAIFKENHWGSIQLLPFNKTENSYGHPSFDAKTNTLYFASDMPGGKGGKDIYSVKLNGAEWGNPVNLEKFNSPKDDVFPFVINDDIFIASNRVGGKGGLDIYWANLKDNKMLNFESINTDKDDFGIFILPGFEKGFLSSNRDGSDDIYFLNIIKKVTVSNELAGKFSYRNLSTETGTLKVMLMNEEGEISYQTITKENGEFKFTNLDLNQGYTIKVISEEELDLIIYDKDGNPVAHLVSDEKGSFTYKKLEFKDVSTLKLIPENFIDFENEKGHLSGQFVYEKDPGSYPKDVQVILYDENGKVAHQTLTDKRGNFDFKNLSMNENYLLKINPNEEGLILLIFDKKGNVVAQLKANSDGQFIYRKLNANFSTGLQSMSEQKDEFQLETRTISGNFNYKNLEGNFNSGLTIYIYNDEGMLIATEKTNDKGEFRFRNLPLSDNFLFKIEENGVLLSMTDFTLFIEDRYGKKVAELRRGENGYFIFKPLGFEVNNNLTKLNEGDVSIDYVKPALSSKVDLVYFDSNKIFVKKSDLNKLDAIAKKMQQNPKLKLEVNAYADSRSSDEYNLILSGKRGDWVVDYLVKKGIAKNRFIVNSYGEGNLVNNCGDDTDCAEEEHAKNRRAELRIYE